MAEAIIALGSNVGDRDANLKNALRELGRYGKVTAVSSVYETEPVYFEDQEWFLNAAASLQTDLDPPALLLALQSVETSMGRRRGTRYGPRVIDLDILFYDALVVSEPDLQIPHPRLVERMFVLVPLLEIRPNLIHPILRVPVSELAAGRKGDPKTVRKLGSVDVP